MQPLHILQSTQFDRNFLDNLFVLANKIRKLNQTKEGLVYLASLLNHKRAMLYFTQPSTRTFLSFHSACHILGIKTSEIRDPAISSEKKGESIEDSLRTFSSYVDIIIMRSPISGLCQKIASLLDETQRSVPIINAGSGPDEHPTQALLDLYTLNNAFAEKDGLENKVICMVGDLKRGRTICSLSKILPLYKNIKLLFISPAQFKINTELRDFLKNTNTDFVESCDFSTAMQEADAIYMTRLQDEYDSDGKKSYIDLQKFSLRQEHLKKLKNDCVILHPMPRRQELDCRIDHDPRAHYWRQERNGMWIRVALILKIFERYQEIVSL